MKAFTMKAMKGMKKAEAKAQSKAFTTEYTETTEKGKRGKRQGQKRKAGNHGEHGGHGEIKINKHPECGTGFSGGGRTLKKLNIGSGGKPLDHYINVDVNPKAPRVDVVHNLDHYPWPFEDDSIDEIVMMQCLEHLIDRNRAMKEVHRILKKEGMAKITVPHFTWQLAYADPTHRHFFSYETFFYYAREAGYFDFIFSSCKVRIVFGKRLSIWNYLLEPIFNRFPTAYEQSPLRMFPALSIEAILTK